MPRLTPEPDGNRGRRQGGLALVFFGLALLMIYLPAPHQQQVAALLRSTVLRPFIATQEILARTRVHAMDVDRLRSEMDSLASALTNQNTLAEENRRLRRLLELSRRVGPAYASASVLRPGTEGSESMFLLDVGGEDGVREGAPVVVGDGLVGVVREVRSGRAIGMDWTHPDFRASAMTVDGETYGIVEPRRGDFREEDRLMLTGTPYHTRLEDGLQIVTSGRGGIYPRGIPVGTVDGLAEAEGGWRKTYWVRPAVEVGSVTHALVATRPDSLRPDDLRPAMVGEETDSAVDSADPEGVSDEGDEQNPPDGPASEGPPGAGPGPSDAGGT